MRFNNYTTDPFTDLLFNALLGFTFMFFIAIMFLNPIAKLGSVDYKAEYIITVTWPAERPDDVDVWVENPNGEVVSYMNPDAGWLHLDRDDQGDVTDKVVINGEEIVYPINQEVVTIRGILAGQYVVNLYYYENRSHTPVPVNIKVEKVNPSLELVYIEDIVLQGQDDEYTVVRLNMSGDGKITSMSKLQKTLTPYLLEPA